MATSSDKPMVCYVVRRDNGTNDDNPHHAEFTVAVYADMMQAIRALMGIGCEPDSKKGIGQLFWKGAILYWIEEVPFYA